MNAKKPTYEDLLLRIEELETQMNSMKKDSDCVDNKDLQTAKNKLNASEARFRLIADISPDMIFHINRVGKVTYASPATEAILSYKPEEVVGTWFSNYYLESEHEKVKEIMLKAIAKKSIKSVEVEALRKDGSIIPIQISISPIIRNNRVLEIQGIARDISGDIEKEKSLIQIQTAVDQSDEGIAIANISGEIIYVNSALEKLFGFTFQEYKDMGTPGMLITSKKKRQKVDKTNDEGKSWTGELKMKRKSGPPLDIFLRVDIIRDHQGTPIGYIGLHKDISDKKLLERRLERYMKELQRSNKELEQFAYIASHDLQEPLRKVQAFGDRLVTKYKDAIDDKGKDYMARMQNAASRMQEMINGLLSYSRVSTKKKPFQEIDLGKIAEEVVSDLETRISREKGKVEIEKLPIIKGDYLQIRQVFTNIIGNGLKYHNPDIHPIVNVSAKCTDIECIIRIKDNGIGFSQDHAENIFNPFVRLHGRGEFEGTGIGLAIVKKIVERHKGFIEAKSELGKGSTFIISLPLDLKNEETID